MGDSLTNQLSIYVGRERDVNPEYMGSARFGGVGSYSVFNALKPVSSSSTHHTYKGIKMNTPDYIAYRFGEYPIATVYIMLGINDLNMYKDIVVNVQAYESLLWQILDKTPDLNIVVLGITPVTTGFSQKSVCHKPDYMRRFNQALEEMCALNGFGFLNPYDVFADENGFLPNSLATDDGFHLTAQGYEMLVNFICDNAGLVGTSFTQVSVFQEEIQELETLLEELWSEVPDTETPETAQDPTESEDSQFFENPSDPTEQELETEVPNVSENLENPTESHINPPEIETETEVYPEWENPEERNLNTFYQNLLTTHREFLPLELIDVNPVFLQELFSVTPQNCNQILAKQTTVFGVGAVDTFLFLETTSLDEALRLETVWRATLSGFQKEMEFYDPQTYEIYQKSLVFRDENFVAFLISQEAAKMLQAFQSFLA